MAEETLEVAPEITGSFVESLKRNNKQIRGDRATAIAEDAQMTYKREVEDLQIRIKRMERERDAMLDLSPTHADSLILASDFDAKRFTERDIELGVKIRQDEIKLEIAMARYEKLFGKLKA